MASLPSICDIYFYIYINDQIPLKNHVISQKLQIPEQTVQWERQRIVEQPIQYALKHERVS